MLRPNFTPRFQKDMKKLKKKHIQLDSLKDVMRLIVQDTPESTFELKHRHNMHRLQGEWQGSLECHIANSKDWLLIWATTNEEAYFQRTGSHDELFVN